MLFAAPRSHNKCHIVHLSNFSSFASVSLKSQLRSHNEVIEETESFKFHQLIYYDEIRSFILVFSPKINLKRSYQFEPVVETVCVENVENDQTKQRQLRHLSLMNDLNGLAIWFSYRNESRSKHHPRRDYWLLWQFLGSHCLMNQLKVPEHVWLIAILVELNSVSLRGKTTKMAKIQPVDDVVEKRHRLGSVLCVLDRV